jgi:ZIP family zinc transporter
MTSLGDNNRKALLMVLAIAFHNIPEGLAVAVSTFLPVLRHLLPLLGSVSFTSLNVFPLSAAPSAMLNATRNARAAVLVATLTGLVEPVAALISVLVLGSSLSAEALANALVVVGGIMVTVSLKELLPEVRAPACDLSEVVCTRHNFAFFATYFGVLSIAGVAERPKKYGGRLRKRGGSHVPGIACDG